MFSTFADSVKVTCKVLLSEHQSAYLKGKSTITALHNIVNEWLKNINNGPFLFLIYMNDLPFNIGICEMYADDTTIGSNSQTLNDLELHLQQNIDITVKWITDW